MNRTIEEQLQDELDRMGKDRRAAEEQEENDENLLGRLFLLQRFDALLQRVDALEAKVRKLEELT